MGFDPVSYALGKQSGGGGVTVEPLNVTENGFYTPPEGVDGFNEVEVDVTVELAPLNVSENGSYTPPAGADGFSAVEVAVPVGFAPLDNQAGGGDIASGCSAYDAAGNEIVGEAGITAGYGEWSSAGLGTFPAGTVVAALAGGGMGFGLLTATITLGQDEMTETIPVIVNRSYEEESGPYLMMTAGANNGTMGMSMLLSGSGNAGGLTAQALWLDSGGTLTDLTSQAAQILSDLTLKLVIPS
jgi:hypothetical protein